MQLYSADYVDDLRRERDRYREALEELIASCTEWSNDDIRDYCRAVIGG
jgi:hypothetical protein